MQKLCILISGYRHIRLRSNTGETLVNATLFVHVAVTNRKGGGVSEFLMRLYFAWLIILRLSMQSTHIEIFKV
jgi:hypothetical protein